MNFSEKVEIALYEAANVYEATGKKGDCSLEGLLLKRGISISYDDAWNIADYLKGRGFITDFFPMTDTVFINISDSGIDYCRKNTPVNKHSLNTYNIYISSSSGAYNLLAISEKHLNIVVNAWLKGETSFYISGQQYWCKGFDSLQIFKNDQRKAKTELERLKNEFGEGYGFGNFRYFLPEQLEPLGTNITEELIGNFGFGAHKKAESIITEENFYINTERIKELELLKSNLFDLSKLIKICQELNSNWIDKNYFTVGLLVRTIINHVPPIFGQFESFDQVVSQYGGTSFKKNAKALNESLRSIADSYTHQTVRKKEVLPNPQQVDFRHNLDFLLSEIIIRLH